MFGHHHKLYKDGVPARSVIISLLIGVENTVGHLKSERMVDSDAIPQETEKQKVFFDVVADVELDYGAKFQHRERLWRHQVGICRIGDVLPVRYDRHNQNEIVFDLPELESNRNSPKERADGSPRHDHDHDFMQRLDPAQLGELGMNSVLDFVNQIKQDPQGFRERMQRVAQEAGTNTFVVTSTSTSVSSFPAEEAGTQTGFPAVDFKDDEVEDI
jgi:hypothetical protein